MRVCMIMLNNRENMVRLSSTMLDYGFIFTCNKGSTKFPKSNPLRILLDDGTTPGPTTFVEKSRLSVVSRVD